jgi:hypothetical protein
MARVVYVVFFLVYLGGSLGCHQIQAKGNGKADEIALIDKIKAAVAVGVDQSKIEEYVGEPASCNTAKVEDRRSFKFAKLEPTRGTVAPNPRADCPVVCWDLRTPMGGPPEIVGVWWNEANQPVLFFASLLPP